MNQERINKISNMTLEEKAALVGGSSIFGSVENKAQGIERLQFLDGGTGINFEQLFGDFAMKHEEAEHVNGMATMQILEEVWTNFYEPEKMSEAAFVVYGHMKKWLDEWTGLPDMAPGCYPPGILLGATFNPEVVCRVGEALGLEAMLYHVDYLLGTPNVNLHRDPKNGRLFEGYSEDPCVVGTLAPALVKGVQKYPVIANVKHFAANNQETNRIGIDERISKRALYELYFPGFAACVKAGVMSVMSAYNKINGEACTQNKWLLTDVLRKEWGFEGLVMSDWGAVYDPVCAIAAGNDLNMPGPVDAKPIADAVKSGELDEAVLNQAVYNILSVYDWLMEQREKAKDIHFSNADVEIIKKKTDAIAYEAAKEGIILLKNENSIFPIKSNKSVAIVGSGRGQMLSCGTGSAGITTNRNTNFAEELRAILGEDSVFVCESCCGDEAGSKTGLSKAESCDYVLVVASLQGQEGNDRKDLLLSPYDEQILRHLAAQKTTKNFKLGLILNVCGPVDLMEFLDDIDGIFCTFLPGMQGARALAKLVCGLENPSGKLPLSFPKHDEDTPSYINFPGDGSQVTYGEGIFVGYRYYDKKKVKPLYPFGYGLSYTTFEIGNLKTSKVHFDDEVEVHFTIKNTGARAGAQVVQLYVSDVCASKPKPLKELKRFKKIYLQPGESVDGTFTLKAKDFEYFDMDYDCFLCEEGYFDLIVATSSAEADVAGRLRVYKNGRSPYSYGLQSTIKVLYEEPSLKSALVDWWTSEGLDIGVLDSTYQYSNSRKLEDVIPSDICKVADQNGKLRQLLEQFARVEKR